MAGDSKIEKKLVAFFGALDELTRFMQKSISDVREELKPPEELEPNEEFLPVKWEFSPQLVELKDNLDFRKICLKLGKENRRKDMTLILLGTFPCNEFLKKWYVDRREDFFNFRFGRLEDVVIRLKKDFKISIIQGEKVKIPIPPLVENMKLNIDPNYQYLLGRLAHIASANFRLSITGRYAAMDLMERESGGDKSLIELMKVGVA